MLCALVGLWAYRSWCFAHSPVAAKNSAFWCPRTAGRLFLPTANPVLAKTRRFDTVAVMFSLSASKRVNAAFAELGQITLLAREVVSSLF